MEDPSITLPATFELTDRFEFATDVPVGLVLAVTFLLFAVLVGSWVYWDARRRDRAEWAPLVGVIVGGLFLAGSLPGLVAFAVADDAAMQGFPTSVRLVPGLVALGLYLHLR